MDSGARHESELEVVFHASDQRNKNPGKVFIYHILLFQILRGEVEAAAVHEFFCDDRCIDDPDREYVHHTTEFDDLRSEATAVISLIRQAVASSIWLEHDTSSWVDAIAAGNEDAVLCLLVPLLSNLRGFIAPLKAPRLDCIIQRIATASTQRQPALENLVLVSFPAENGDEVGAPLQRVAIYAALPSVRRLVVPSARSFSREGDFPGWTLPLSHAKEVYFFRPSVVPADVRKFAQGFAGPCVMRQWWHVHGSQQPDGQPDVEWDYYDVEAGGMKIEWHGTNTDQAFTSIALGSRKEVMELRFPDAHEEWNDDPSTEYSDEMNAMIRYELWDWEKVS